MARYALKRSRSHARRPQQPFRRHPFMRTGTAHRLPRHPELWSIHGRCTTALTAAKPRAGGPRRGVGPHEGVAPERLLRAPSVGTRARERVSSHAYVSCLRHLSERRVCPLAGTLAVSYAATASAAAFQGRRRAQPPTAAPAGRHRAPPGATRPAGSKRQAYCKGPLIPFGIGSGSTRIPSSHSSCVSSREACPRMPRSSDSP